MKLREFNFFGLNPIVAIVLAVVCGVSGCSSSGSAQSPEPNEPNETIQSAHQSGQPNSPSESSATVNNNPVAADPIPNETIQSAHQSGQPNNPSESSAPVNNNPVVADPETQNTVLVTFDITVPAYQSNALRVELKWGDIDLVASWVGDEFWTASGEFPTDSEQLLSATFYDFDGDLELASFSQQFRTGTNTSESIQIQADQFDETQFDSDQDGVNNLEEMLAGTDPTMDEDSQLEIVEFYELSEFSRMSVSHNLEARLSEERPFYNTFELEPDFPHYTSFRYLPVSGEADIDADGNGTLSYDFYRRPVHRLGFNAIRTNSGTSISWEGKRGAYNGDYGHGVDFVNTITRIDENTRGYTEEITGSNIGTYKFTWETSTNLTGRLIEGTSLCEPVAGTISTTHRTNPGDSVAVYTVNKEIDDPYWRVTTTYNDSETVEHFARKIKMFRSLGIAESDAGPIPADSDYFDYFICDFVDF